MTPADDTPDEGPESLSDKGALSAKDAGSRGLPAERVARNLETAAAVADKATAPNTKRAYRSDRAAWERYAAEVGCTSFPIDPMRLAAFIGEMIESGLRPATILRRCAALSSWHRDAGEASPTDDRRVRKALEGVRREGAPTRKRALTVAMIRRAWPELSVRDRALVLTGFACGLRRSELVALRWEDVTETPAGFDVFIPRSKSDQRGDGAHVAIVATGSELCPAAALRAWVSRLG